MKFGLFADPHYSKMELSNGTRRHSLSFAKVQTAMEYFVREKADLVLCLGDFVDHSDDHSQVLPATKSLCGMIRSFGLPFYSLMGNHDCQLFTPEEFQMHTEGFLPPFSLRFGQTVLLFPNANFEDDGRAYVPGQVDWTNTYLPPSELLRLRQALEDPTTQTAYIFLHQNLDPTVEAHHIIRNAAEVRAMLEASGKVHTVFQGHYHLGNETLLNSIRYITLPAMCEGEQNPFFLFSIE